jgi:hypothetical protein
MATPPDAAARTLAAAYAIDMSQPISAGDAAEPGLGGIAYPATARQSGRADLMALVVPKGQPPRAAILATLGGANLLGVMMPIDHGRITLPGGQIGYAVITEAPPGPGFRLPAAPMAEADLLDQVLKPAAAALAKLHARGVTHRNIRPGNLFLSGGERPGVVLGPAWTTPPASLQPPAYDPPYSAMCLPGGRGEGSPADDVYALGATLLALAVGRELLPGLDATAVVSRKLALGSFAALLEDDRLSSVVGDLVRGMLADDPDHRPSATLLTDPVAARGRRISSRPKRRAGSELQVGTLSVPDARTLAHAMATQPGPAMQLLQSGAIDVWLRRDVGDAAVAQKIEEVVRTRRLFGAFQAGRPDPHLLAGAIAVLDPLTPLCWDGIAWWPDATGPAMATAAKADADRIAAAVDQDAIAAWAMLRTDRVDAAALTTLYRQARILLVTPGPAFGRPRMLYMLNPLLPCAAPALAPACVCHLADVLPALEGMAAIPEQRRSLPLDAELSAFLAARADQTGGGAITQLLERPPKDSNPPLFQLRVLAAVQSRLRAPALPGIAGWLNEHTAPLLEDRRNNAARAALAERVKSLAEAGQLGPMLAALEDPAAQQADDHGASNAQARIRALDDALQAIADGAPARAEYAQRLGQELAVGAGMTAVAAALALMAFG